MKYLELNNWKRKNQFKLFEGMANPHFNICFNLDITRFHALVKEGGFSFYHSMVHAAARTANSIEEFRLRIRGNQIVLHDIVHPSFTFLKADETFGFCRVEYTDSHAEFVARVDAELNGPAPENDLIDVPGKDDLLYITCIPWVSFTSLSHPVLAGKPDSIPRFAWGKYFRENSTLKLPFSLQANHCLMDGFHVGKFAEAIQETLDGTG